MQRFSWETCTVCAAGANVLMLRAGVQQLLREAKGMLPQEIFKSYWTL